MFSVVIPAYNAEKYIKRSVISVLNQTANFNELIVVNDGSTDRTLDILSEINDPRLKILSHENQGVSITRNRGAKEASSRWISFLDADDEWFPYHLQTLHELIEVNSTSGLVATQSAGTKTPQNRIDRVDMYRFLIDYPGAIQTSTFAVAKSKFLAIGGFKEGQPLGEDTDLYLRMCENYNCSFIPVETSVYHRGTGGVMERVQMDSEKKPINCLYDVRYAAGALYNRYKNKGFTDSQAYFINSSINMKLRQLIISGSFFYIDQTRSLVVGNGNSRRVIWYYISFLNERLLTVFFRIRWLFKVIYKKVNFRGLE